MSFVELFSLMPAYAVFVAVMVFVLGCCMGSFINCLAWRTVHGESVMRGRSHCAVCGHQLSFLDLIPVLSWVFLRGKCRYCGEPVSVRYAITELLCGFFFLSVLLAFGIDVRTPFLMALGCVLLGLSLVDLDSMIIPNKFVLVGVVLWAAMLACEYAARSVGFDSLGSDGFGVAVGAASGLVSDGASALSPVVDGLLSAVVISGLVLVVSCVFKALTGKAGMGMGDIKLYFMVSLYLGLAAGVLNLFLSCIVGLAFAVVTAGRGSTPVAVSSGDAVEDDVEAKGTLSGKAFPFGPSIALATWFCLLFGQSLVSAYLGLF